LRATVLSRRFILELGDTHILGLVRLLLGGMVFSQTLDALREFAQDGYFGDAFHMAWLPETLLPSSSGYAALLVARLVLSVVVVVGYRPRLPLLATAIIGIYLLACDGLQYHHNRYALSCFSALIALSPCDRSWVLAGPVGGGGARVGPLWAARLAQFQLSLIYVASGGSKLLDRDWRQGFVLGDRIFRYGGEAVARGVPQEVIDLLVRPEVSGALSKLAIATELFIAVGVWLGPTRIYALWLGVMFHLSIEVTSYVDVFTWLTLTIYALFATHDYRARQLYFDPTRARGRLYARLVRWLDWLARFEVKPWAPDDIRKGHVIVIVRRDGTRATGVRALAMVARCVPLLFPLWAPLSLVASFTKGGEVAVSA